MKLLSILLQEAQPGGLLGSSSMFIPILLMFVVLYFFMLRPQQKKQKEIQKMRESMKVGDRVITSGGIHGKIKEVEETAFIIEIAEGVRIKVDKASVFAAANDIQANK